MNILMPLGFGIMVVGAVIVLILLYKWHFKERNYTIKRRLLLLLILVGFIVVGGFIAQTGENQVRTQFNEDELALVESDKSFSDFSDEEKKVFAMVKFRFFAGDEEKMSVYYDKILNWAIDEYISHNTDRTDLTRSDVEGFILKDWAQKRGN